MSDTPQPWVRSAYPDEARDVYEALGALVRAINETLTTLDPATLTAERAHALQRWRDQWTVDPDSRRDIPRVFDHMQDLAILLNDEALLQRVAWTMDAFQQWLQRVAEPQPRPRSKPTPDDQDAP